MSLCTRTLWKPPKWELENSNTVSFSLQSQGLERGCQDGGQGMARRVGSWWGATSGFSVQPIKFSH